MRPQPNLGDLIGLIATLIGMLMSAFLVPSPHHFAGGLVSVCLGGLLSGVLHSKFDRNGGRQA